MLSNNIKYRFLLKTQDLSINYDLFFTGTIIELGSNRS